ncbi:hypothetical protein AQ505_08080 [Pedobacter sp. PACM 27299]|uniref:SDR family NAD(P)-dependent oxidoreductase n=1 Tax=Pedobacter sp. PACM 27299 TaxID=1727164 RepID=UPI000705F9DA|nr:SDR family NAD(P)-dependent oxidoreductase [Pedobacter sp. PACM 27299]ALL05453.1 hypothetical protein AQ505_08080 [Pedobacter sp. PACM 27299]
MNLSGKFALITGASSGIGKGIAKALALKGVKLGLAARRTDKLQDVLTEIEEQGGEAYIIKMDVADKGSVTEGLAKLKEQFGSIDILVI